MILKPTNRLALLLPVLGMLIAALFVSLPDSGAQARIGAVRMSLQIPDRESVGDQTFEHAEKPSQGINRARRFHVRARALAPVSALHNPVLITVRAAVHLGRYVLRYADTREDTPASSQYAYLFRLTPF